MTAFDITCARLVELVTKYLEDLVAEQDRVSIELHLLQCPTCVTHLDNVRQTIRMLSSLRASPVSPERRQALLRAFSPGKDAQP